MAGRSLVLVALLALACAGADAAGASSGDAQRFGRFASHARASGTMTMVLTYEGTSKAGCDAAGTCGVKGTVTARLVMDPARKVAAVPGGIVVLPGKGGITATASSPRCSERLKLTSAGIAFTGDAGGLLLRPGAFVAGVGAQDPFATRCGGPALADLGRPDILPAVRLKKVPTSVTDVRLRFGGTTRLQRAGYAATVSVRGSLRLRAA